MHSARNSARQILSGRHASFDVCFSDKMKINVSSYMNNQPASVVRLTLFKNSYQSFIVALDEAKIRHERAQLFSTKPQASGIIEVISELSDSMPWNSLTKVIIAWIDARKSREIIIQTSDGRIIHAKGYSANEIRRALSLSVNVTVIDSNSSDEM